MSIVALHKITLLGTIDERDDVVNRLQQLGCAHLVDLSGNGVTIPTTVSKEARRALRLLETSPVRRSPVLSTSGYDRDQVINDVLQMQGQRQELIAERDRIATAITELEPWGSFHKPSQEHLGGRDFYFYVVPIGQLENLDRDLLWHIAARDATKAYVLVLSNQIPDDVPGTRVELDSRPLEELRDIQDAISAQLDELDWKRASLTRFRSRLKRDLDLADDLAARSAAAKGVLGDDAVFAIQAWVPKTATPDVKRLAAEMQLAITIAEPNADDTPPTLLKNPKRIAGAEGCVTFYMTPGYHTWDPTAVVYFSLSLFFAMIVSDAGYGAVMLGGLAVLWKSMGSTPAKIRMRHLLASIFLATIAYGVLVGSYFGVSPPQGSFLDAVRLRIDGEPMMENRSAMMLISVAIGVAHLTLANVISAVNARASLRWIGHLGWAVTMIAAFLLIGGEMIGSSAVGMVAKCLLPVGAVAVIFFSSDQPIATWHIKPHLLRLVDGLFQIANIPKAFGDTLSYLRLFALGLASAQLATTFNGLASDAFAAGGLGILAGLTILVLGHAINFMLAIMGGVVHGLRLNCIEFFNWSLTDEGYPFQPFQKKAET